MKGYELNKIFASVLIALLAAMTGSLLGEGIISPQNPRTKVLQITVQEEESTDQQEKPLAPISPLLVKADVKAGEKIFQQKCTQCHTTSKGEGHKVGPNLWNVVGRKIAEAAGFAYSNAFKEKGGNWEFEAINAYLHKPNKYIKGTKMSFAGLAKDEDRANVIEYLRNQEDSPVAKPSK